MTDIHNYSDFNPEENSTYRVVSTTTVDTDYMPNIEEYITEGSTPGVVEEHVEDVDAFITAATSNDPDIVNVDEEFDRLVNDAEQSEHTPDIPEGASVDAPVEESPVDLLSLPQLSDSFLVEERTARFSSAVWYERAKMLEVTIVGAGGIGSWAAILIARLGAAKITIYDADDVDSSNMAGQFYEFNDVGTNKASCLGTKIRRFVGNNLICNCHRVNFYQGVHYPNRITIGAVDNMAARRQVFEKWLHLYRNDSTALLIDGRLSADELQIFAMRGNQLDRIEKYEKDWLFSDEEADETNCSFKQTSYMAAMIGALICNCVVNHCANLADENVMFDLPFFISYSSETMYFKAPNV